MRTSFTGGYVLEEAIYYMGACLAGGHVKLEYMYEWRCILEIQDLM